MICLADECKKEVASMFTEVLMANGIGAAKTYT